MAGWVSYVVVVGDEEVASKKLTVTVRKKSQPGKPFREQMTVDSLIAAVRKDVEGKPFRPLYTPRKLSDEGTVYLKFSFFRFFKNNRRARGSLSSSVRRPLHPGKPG